MALWRHGAMAESADATDLKISAYGGLFLQHFPVPFYLNCDDNLLWSIQKIPPSNLRT